MAGVVDYSSTPAANTAINGIPIGENALTFANINNVMRQQLADIAAGGIQAGGAWTDVASATSTAIGAVNTGCIRITGTTTITSFDTIGSGTLKLLRFAAALTLTHNGTSLILPGAANITTQTGDSALAVSLGSGNWQVLFFQTAAGVSGSPRGLLFGLTLSNDGSDPTNDIGIATGVATSDQSPYVAMTLGTALIKRLDANWAAGTNQGMRNSAAAITDTTYHIYLVAQAAGAAVDIYAHTSATVATVLTALQAETGGSGYIFARRIGSLIRASAALVTFTQVGDKFQRTATPVVDVNVTSSGTSAVTRTLSVPLGIVVEPIISVTVDAPASGGEQVYLSSLTQTDVAADGNTAQLTVSAITAFAQQFSGCVTGLATNTSGQIRSRQAQGGSGQNFRIKTGGWIDLRGRT